MIPDEPIFEAPAQMIGFIGAGFALLGYLPVMAGLVLGPASLAYQAFIWLYDGQWYPYGLCELSLFSEFQGSDQPSLSDLADLSLSYSPYESGIRPVTPDASLTRSSA